MNGFAGDLSANDQNCASADCILSSDFLRLTFISYYFIWRLNYGLKMATELWLCFFNKVYNSLSLSPSIHDIQIVNFESISFGFFWNVFVYIHTCIAAAVAAAAGKASASVCTHSDWQSRGMIQIVREHTRTLQRSESAISYRWHHSYSRDKLISTASDPTNVWKHVVLARSYLFISKN